MSEAKRKYYAWNEPSMQMAIEAVRKKVVGLNDAARMYGVPKATLKRRLDGSNQKAKEAVQIVGSEGDIPPELEKEICDHILDMERSLYGVTPIDIRRLACDLAEKNNIKHRFNKEKRTAGKKWYYSFMKRHPQLSLRQPRATSMSRATGFNKPVVKDFYDKLEAVMDKHDINDAQRIFNMDETGLSTVQRKPRKILALKGKRQVGAITSGERGTTTTAVCCASAAGFFVPPLIIFKRKRAKDELKDGAPPGTIFAFNPDSGYINKEIFYVWLQHFVETVKPTPEKKILLLLDGHASHTKNLAAITFAKTHGVVILSFPAHTTHKLQPLDVSFFKPLSLYYIDETEKWLRQNPGRTVTTFQVSMLFGKAYSRAASVGTASNGFTKSGIYPLNKDVFQDYEFIVPEEEENINPSIQDDPLAVNSPTRRESLEEYVESRLESSRSVEVQSKTLEVMAEIHAEHFDETPTLKSRLEDSRAVEVQSKTSITMEVIAEINAEQLDKTPDLDRIEIATEDNTTAVNINVTPEVLPPEPRQPDQSPEAQVDEVPATPKVPRKSNRNKSSKFDFHVKQLSPGAIKIATELRQRSKRAQCSTELTSSPYKKSLEEAAEKTKKPTKQPKKREISKKEPKPSTSKRSKIESDENIEKWFCKICLHCSIEDMIQCLICKAWVHTECACVHKNVKKFICPLCKT